MANTASIPIIDISDSQGDQTRIAEELIDAAAKHGFVYIRNTGQDISLPQVEQAFSIVC
jgi:isopenicillin N synthase-like dioxygenase